MFVLCHLKIRINAIMVCCLLVITTPAFSVSLIKKPACGFVIELQKESGVIKNGSIGNLALISCNSPAIADLPTNFKGWVEKYCKAYSAVSGATILGADYNANECRSLNGQHIVVYRKDTYYESKKALSIPVHYYRPIVLSYPKDFASHSLL